MVSRESGATAVPVDPRLAIERLCGDEGRRRKSPNLLLSEAGQECRKTEPRVAWWAGPPGAGGNSALGELAGGDDAQEATLANSTPPEVEAVILELTPEYPYGQMRIANELPRARPREISPSVCAECGAASFGRR